MQRLAFAALLIFFSSNAMSQEKGSDLDDLYSELDSIFADEIVPGDLFKLADSLLALDNAKVSALNVRAGYVSQVVSAGRSFGVQQYGFTPGVTYFHHTGFYGGVSGYWTNEYDPGYYLTDLSAGYTYTYKNKLMFQANHAFYLYNDSLDTHSVDKSAQVAINFQPKWFEIGTDYSYLYGSSAAHRINAHANLRWKLNPNGWIDAITFMPGIAGQWGNADVFYWRQPRTAVTDLYQIIRSNDYPLLERGDYLRLAYLLETDRELAAVLFLLQRDYTQGQIRDLFDAYYAGDVSVENTFGFLNFSVSFPVILRAGRFSLLLNYTYNLPQALPGETVKYESSGYFSASMSYMLTWLKK